MSVASNNLVMSSTDSKFSEAYTGTDAAGYNGETPPSPGLSREDSYLSEYEPSVPVIKPYSARYRRQSARLSVQLARSASPRPVSRGGEGRGTGSSGANLSNDKQPLRGKRYTVSDTDSLSDIAQEEQGRSVEEDAKTKQYKMDVVQKILAEFDLEKTLLKYRTMEKETMKLNPMDFDHER